MLILVENYHIIKFLKEEGVFQEGKWWNIRDEDYLRQIRQKLEKELENLLDKVNFYTFFISNQFIL